jgi:hypothetical protein
MMRKSTALALIGLALLTCAACEKIKGRVLRNAVEQFADQAFKTAIAHVEVYKLRHGEYPKDLGDLDFLGEWDRNTMRGVVYERLPDGYELDLSFVTGKPHLEYPPAFWNGLGLKKSNVRR